MAEPGNFDPIAAWQQAVGAWERQINEMSAKISATEEFAGPLNQISKYSLAARRSLDEGMEKLVQSMQVASSAQMQAIGERLDRIEERLDTLIAGQQQPSAGAGDGAAPEPRRTRQPPGEAP